MKKLVSIADVCEFLQDKVDRFDALLARMDADRADGRGPEFLRNGAVELAVAAAHAKVAGLYLKFATTEHEPDGTEYPEDRRFTDIFSEISVYFMQRIESQFAETRSTSPSANMAKDAEREFFVEFYRRLNGGY
jgi:hypothetical protein